MQKLMLITSAGMKPVKTELHRGPVSLYRIHEGSGVISLSHSTPLCPLPLQAEGGLGTLLGHPQTCVYPDVCLGIAHVSARPLAPGEGLYQIHGQSLHTSG